MTLAHNIDHSSKLQHQQTFGASGRGVACKGPKMMFPALNDLRFLQENFDTYIFQNSVETDLAKVCERASRWSCYMQVKI